MSREQLVSHVRLLEQETQQLSDRTHRLQQMLRDTAEELRSVTEALAAVNRENSQLRQQAREIKVRFVSDFGMLFFFFLAFDIFLCRNLFLWLCFRFFSFYFSWFG